MANSYSNLTSDANGLLNKMCEEYELRRTASMHKKQSGSLVNTTNVHE